jgi:hypothetical protein
VRQIGGMFLKDAIGVIVALFLGACALGVVAADYIEPQVTLENREINGSSGLAASFSELGVFYTHNDGGNNRIFTFDRQGRNRGTWILEGVTAHDVEEMASSLAHAEQMLWLVDTGNNRTPEREPADVFHLHMVLAPKATKAGAKPEVKTIAAAQISTVQFRFEGGKADCEAVAVDVLRNQILLINKVPRVAQASANLSTNVYALKLDEVFESLAGEEVVEAKRIVMGMPPLPEQITGMDISRDGKKAVIQTYDDAYEFDFDTDWKTTFSKPYSRKIAVRVEPTGHPKNYTFRESICYGPAGHSLFITRELSSWEIENTDRRTPLWQIR